MKLEVRPPRHVVPSYSLTGDLLSYLRCRLQYRYHNGSSLPPSRPVQMWFGEFLHGTLEMAYRYWKENECERGAGPSLPWPCNVREWRGSEPDWANHDIGKFGDTVETALQQQGKQVRSSHARESAYRRVETAVNELGPHLFPLIASAERKVIGTRPVPSSQKALRCVNYEVHGVIDVLTNVTLSTARDGNIIRNKVLDTCKLPEGEYEVIVDYKGSRRPLVNEQFWDQGDWQIQTYAWLRGRQADALPVAAGILVYVNELTPGREEMEYIRRGVSSGTTDEFPAGGSRDEQLARMWRDGMDSQQLSLSFRLRRAIRVIPISRESTEGALASFDDVVRRAEEDIVAEATSGILQAWAPNSEDEGTCTACDFRHFCPKPYGKDSQYMIEAPSAP